MTDKSEWRDEAGRFKLGNRWWEARSSHGRNPKFDSPEHLLSACLEYVTWVEENPLWEVKAWQHQGEVVTAKLPKMRAMTIGGLCTFLDIENSTWEDYRTRPDFHRICAQIDRIIRTQKFEGASADLLNHAIIARDLGLAEKKEVGGPDGGPIKLEITDPEQARRAAEAFLDQ